MTSNVSLTTALALMRQMDKLTAADFDSIGVTDQDWNITCGEGVFLRNDIPVVVRTLNSLIFGTLEMQGISKIVVPVEYVAPVIAVFVKPQNWHLACIYLAQENRIGPSALELSARQGNPGEVEKCSADQLFALVALIVADGGHVEVRQRFAKRMSLAVQNALGVKA
ncbi:scaffold protein [Microviridae sp.]|nr:scaffold protein [Microviridae sp.]